MLSNRYSTDAWFGPGKAGHVGRQYGDLTEDLSLAYTDANFWFLGKRGAEAMDLQQRLLLEGLNEYRLNSSSDWRGEGVGWYVGVQSAKNGSTWKPRTPRMYRVIGTAIALRRIGFPTNLTSKGGGKLQGATHIGPQRAQGPLQEGFTQGIRDDDGMLESVFEKIHGQKGYPRRFWY